MRIIMDWFVQNYSIIAVVFFLVVAAVSHLVTPPSYDWRENSISELAAQKYNNKWIMQIGLSGFGFLLGGGILIRMVQGGSVWFQEIPILIYAISILMTGVFCTKPFFESDDYSHFEDRVHSIFANLTGISFSLGVTMRMVLAISLVDFILNTVFLFLVLAGSIAFSKVSTGRGIVQRGIFFLGFLWLVSLY
ncbi:MAG: DUF998 domain-containing protein [Candidatus Thorarchaeota archaeon]|jgi:hypothetical membrane protein